MFTAEQAVYSIKKPCIHIHELRQQKNWNICMIKQKRFMICDTKMIETTVENK
jgi:hypothetical protein